MYYNFFFLLQPLSRAHPSGITSHTELLIPQHLTPEADSLLSQVKISYVYFLIIIIVIIIVIIIIVVVLVIIIIIIVVVIVIIIIIIIIIITITIIIIVVVIIINRSSCANCTVWAQMWTIGVPETK